MSNRISKVIIRVLIVLVFVVMEYVLSYWNTNQILVGKGDYSEESIEQLFMASGMRYAHELTQVSSAEQLENIGAGTAFFLEDVSFEPTGYFKLLNDKNEGYVRKGKTHNLVYRDYFATEGLATRLYRGMYGQFYRVTFKDGTTSLVLVSCNNEKAIEKGDYANIIARIKEGIPRTKKVKDDNEIYQTLTKLEQQQTISEGYVDMADYLWADKHRFGIFMMSALKFAISFGVTLAVLLIYSSVSGNDIE